MDETLHELNLEGLNMKLTNEKLYVNSATSNETFALRSVNGIGIVDLVEKFNQELKEWKTSTNRNNLMLVIAFLFFIFIFSVIYEIVLVIGVTILIYIYLNKIQSKTKPSLKSAVRIMLNGMSRDFEFDKQSSNSENVAKFVALVEDTLTSYHKNN